MKLAYYVFTLVIVIFLNSCEIFNNDEICKKLDIKKKWHLEAYFYYDLDSIGKRSTLYANELVNSIPDYFYPPDVLKGELEFKNNSFTHVQQLLIKRNQTVTDTIKINDKGTYILNLRNVEFGISAYYEGNIILRNQNSENKYYPLIKRCDDEKTPLILRHRIGRDSFSFHYVSE